MKDLHDFTERGVKRALFFPFLPVQNRKKAHGHHRTFFDFAYRKEAAQAKQKEVAELGVAAKLVHTDRSVGG
jgi:hypothetical protein